MLKSKTLALEQSELREKINGYLQTDGELTEEQRADMDKCTKRAQELEPELRAAMTVETEESEKRTWSGAAEGREYRANVGTIFDCLLTHQNPSGVEAELQAHHNLGGNQIPLDLLRGYGGGGRGHFEERAVTPGATNVGTNQREIIPYVFPQACATYLGVDMPSVPAGDAVFPVLTSTLSVVAAAENAAVSETTGAFSSDVLTPSRLQASFFYSREDRARFATMDNALRMNLSEGLADGLDDQILTGTNGLFTGTNLANNNVTTADSYDTYISNLMYGQIDGRYASMASDLRMVVGSETYADMGATYRNNSVDRSVLDRIMEMTGGVKVSAHVPVADANNRQNAVIMRGMSMTAVAPTWEGITLIPDEVTKASEGQIIVTAVMLYAIKILRTGAGLVKQQVQHS